MPREKHDIVFYVPSMGPLFRPGSTRPPGGAETQLFMLSQRFAALGYRVAVVCYDVPGGLPSTYNRVRIITRGAPYVPRSRLTGKINEALKIWRALWKARGSVIVKRCSGIDVGIVGLYARAVGSKYVFSSANIMDFNPKDIHLPKRRDRALYTLGVKLADTVVVQTDEQVGMCERLFEIRPTVIKSIVEIPVTPAQATPEAFLWIGRAVDYKKPMEYVELARSAPDLRFRMIVVPFDEHESGRELLDQIRRAQAELPNLELLAPRSRDALGELMNSSVAIVNTADYEGMPNIFLEGWARGIPALALTHDPDDVITRYGLGSFAGGSRERFRQLARELWEQRFSREVVSARCISYLEHHHSPSRVVEEWSDVLVGRASTIQAVPELAEEGA